MGKRLPKLHVIPVAALTNERGGICDYIVSDRGDFFGYNVNEYLKEFLSDKELISHSVSASEREIFVITISYYEIEKSE